MRRTFLLFVAKLVLASILLYIVWEWKGQLWYALVFRQAALAVYGLFGIELASLREALRIVIDRFYNILPFLSLMIAVWGISWIRRMTGTLCGLAALMIWHLAFTLIVQSILEAHGLDSTAYRQLSPWFLLSDALPFVLWVVVAYRPLTEIFVPGGGKKPS